MVTVAPPTFNTSELQAPSPYPPGLSSVNVMKLIVPA
jgi:hypothetical protein